MPAPSPRSLVLDLLSTLRGESMPVGALVAAGQLFGIAENGMRVAVTRLLAGSELLRDERGPYRLRLDAAGDAGARGLWDVAGLRARYRRERGALAASEARLARRSESAAMVESFRLGGRVIRELVRDPLLPEPLLPAAERRALVAALC